MGVDLIEQPVSAQDNAALVRLSQQIETAILADEAVATAYDGYQLAQQGFTGAYALKIAKAGGPNSVLALARVAQAAGLASMAARCWKGPWVPLLLCMPGRHCRCSGEPRCSARCYSKTILSAFR